MPEGPEIRRAADRVGKAVAGQRARHVYFAFDALKRFEAVLSGSMVRAVEARGKACLVHFAGGWSVYSHNQLYGRWYVRQAGRLPRTRRSLRFAVHGASRSALLYSASEIEVLRTKGLSKHAYLGRLGPDPLDSEVTGEHVLAQLVRPRFRRRSLAALLLDQSFLAGVGNYLRSEILWQARLDPRTNPAALSAKAGRALARAALVIPRRSYRTAGITNSVQLARSLRSRGLARREYRHAVFGRGGKACWACSTAIERLRLAGRRIYRCPSCQPAGEL